MLMSAYTQPHATRDTDAGLVGLTDLILLWPAQACGSSPGRNAPDSAAAVTDERVKVPESEIALSLVYSVLSSCAQSHLRVRHALALATSTV